MINTINSDLIRGHIDTIILSVLHEGDRYGYDILGEIEKKSSGQYVLKQPTLYSCLKRLETQGFIYKYWGTETAGGRRTYYSLTEMGKELFLKNKDEWKYSRGVIDKLISTSDDQIEGGTVFVEVSADTSEAAPDNGEIVSAAIAESENQTADELPVTQQTTAAAAPEAEKRISDAYADVLSSAAKDEIMNASAAESPASESYYDKPVNGYCYADRLSHEQPDVKTEEDSLPMSSYFAQDVSEDDEDEAYDQENENDSEYAAFENESGDENDRAAACEPVTDRPFYSDDDFRESADNGQLTMFDLLDEKPDARDNKAHEEKTIFKRYDATELSEEADREIVVGREYRNVIKQLLTGGLDAETYYADLQNARTAGFEEAEKSGQNEVAATESRSRTEESIDGDIVYLEQDKPNNGDFDNLLKSVRSMGDEIRIRTHNGDVDKEYNSLYHYYSNKLLLFKYGLMFAIMILEIVVPYFIIKFGLGIAPIAGELPVLVISVVGAALLPAYAISAYLIDPYRRKRYDYDMKSSMLYRFGIMLLMLVLVYAVNVVFYMDIALEAEYAFSLITPALLTTNIPLSGILFKTLYDTKKFGAE